MKKLQALVSTVLLTLTATLLTTLDIAAAFFPNLSRSDYTPQLQEIQPDFYS